MADLIKYGNFKLLGKNKEKRQIILCHTSREVGEYLTSLKFRFNGKYDRIPHFVISKNGEIVQLLPENGIGNFFSSDNLNKNSIFISLENLGWVEKKTLTNYYINWKGSIYNEEPYEKKWRDYFFWEPYTEEQVQKTAFLCEKLCDNMSIERNCVGHNTKVEGIENFRGITTKSNYNMRYTDLSPSFNFEKFIKLFEHERISR
jgi:hypothetical protein